MSIVTSLLHANYKENLMTRFPANKQNRFKKASFYLIMLPWQRHIRQVYYQKVEDCVVYLLTAIFGDQRIEGFRGKGKVNRSIKNCALPP